MKKAIFAALVLLLFSGCTNLPEAEKLLGDSAKKANALDSYTMEYQRTIVSYVNPNETVHLVPATTITKYKKGDSARWDTRDWLNNSDRLYKAGGAYTYCSLNKTWDCKPAESSLMKEFMGYDVLDPALAIRRQAEEGALLFGPVKDEMALGRKSKCFAVEIHPEKFSKQDWDEQVLGSISQTSVSGMKEPKAWVCLDSETGMKMELVLNYKAEIEGEQRTVEVSIKASSFETGTQFEESFFQPPR